MVKRINEDLSDELICRTCSNYRVEKTDTGNWVVRADSKRFGKDAIVYEGSSQRECLNWMYKHIQPNGYRESVKVKESQQSSAAYYDFQNFLGRLTDYVDENNILVDLKGTKFAGDHHDTFEIIVYGAYSNEEITTIILEHSNRNDYNAWTATFDFDGEYDDDSATYLDDLYETVTGWLDTVSSSGYAESVRRSSRNRATLRESDSAVMIKTTTSDGDYYLIKSATKQKSFWNPSISKVNSFAKKDSAMKKLYQVLEKLPENAFHDPDNIIDVEDESDLKKAKFAKFYITDMSGKTIEDISDEVKKYLLADEKFLDGVFDDLDDEDDMDESLVREARIGKMKSVYVSQEYVPEYGWEDVTVYDDTSYDSLRLAKQDVKSYRDNGYQARVITRKINNPDYVEPSNNITYDEVVAWLDDECPYDKKELYSSTGINYALKTDNNYSFAQVFADSDSDEVSVFNIGSNRTKRVRSIDELVKEVNRIAGQWAK